MTRVKMEDELQNVKKIVRSLLISVKAGLTVREIEGDFEEFEGKKFPYAKFGYSEAGDFLRSMTDVVQFYRGPNGVELLKQVSSKETEHIERLVARQKSAPKKSSKPRGGSSRTRGGRPPKYTQPTSGRHYTNKPSILGNPPLGQWSNSKNSSIQFSRFTGVKPNPRVQPTQEDRDLGESSQTNAVSKEYQSHGVSQSVRGRTLRGQRGRGGYGNQKQEVASLSQVVPCEEVRGDDTNAQLQPSRFRHFSDNRGYVAPEDSQQNASADHEDCIINKSVQEKVREVVKSALKGMWCNRLPVEYRRRFKQELPVREYGFHNTIEFVMAMSHAIRFERPYERGDWLLWDADTPAPMPDEPVGKQKQTTKAKTSPDSSGDYATPHHLWAENRQKFTDEKIEDLKESVRQVLQAHPSGVPHHKFLDVYEDMTGTVLKPSIYGHNLNSLLHLLSQYSVLEIVTLKSGYLPEEGPLLKALPTPGDRRYHYLKDQYKPHVIERAPRQKLRIPQGMVGPGRCYPAIDLSGLEPYTYCEVFVSNVFSPDRFWLMKRRDAVALDKLMDELEAVYSVSADEYRMPKDLMEYGQVCVVLFNEDNNWHRGIITGTVGDKIRVYYVDYGNTEETDPSSICFLFEKFLSLPVQAIQAKMSFLLPPEGEKKFSPAAKDKLLRMVTNRPMQALVNAKENLVLSVVLVDTNQGKDIFINDHLVEAGLARLIDPTMTVQGGGGSANGASARNAGGHGPRYVRKVEFSSENKIKFHLIFLGGQLHVASPEISRLFWEEDVLSNMLQHRNVVNSPLIVGRHQFPELFDELQSYGAFYIDNRVKRLHLYCFASMPVILDEFAPPSEQREELKRFVKHHMAHFDPHDRYWKGVDAETESVGTNESTGNMEDYDPDDILTMDELQTALHSLRYTRKRILRRITLEAECEANDVHELQSTEEAMTQIQELITALEEKKTADLGLGKVSKPTSTQTAASHPQSSFSTLVESRHVGQRNAAIKTNVVSPMVKPTQETSPASSTLPDSSATCRPMRPARTCESLEMELMAESQRMADTIQNSNQTILSMLGMNGDLAPSALPRGLPFSCTGLGDLPQTVNNNVPLLSRNTSAPLLNANTNVSLLSTDPSISLLSQSPSCMIQNLPGSQDSTYLDMFRNPSSMLREDSRYLPLFRNPNPQQDIRTCSQVLPSHSQPLHVDNSTQSHGLPDLQQLHVGQIDQNLNQPSLIEVPAISQSRWMGSQVMDHPQIITVPGPVPENENVSLPESASSTRSSQLPLPMVGVVRPHSAVQPTTDSTPASPSQPDVVHSSSQPSLSLSLPTPPRPNLVPSQGGRGIAPSRWQNPSAVQQQLFHLQQQHMVLQQQAMMQPGFVHPPHFDPCTTPAPTPPVTSGDMQGEGELMPGMVPLLHSFQSVYAVQPSNMPMSSSSSSALPHSQ